MRKYIVDFISAFSGVLSTTAANRGKRCRCGRGVLAVASLQALYARYFAFRSATTAANRGKWCRCGRGVSAVASLQALYVRFLASRSTATAANRWKRCRCGRGRLMGPDWGGDKMDMGCCENWDRKQGKEWRRRLRMADVMAVVAGMLILFPPTAAGQNTVTIFSEETQGYERIGTALIECTYRYSWLQDTTSGTRMTPEGTLLSGDSTDIAEDVMLLQCGGPDGISRFYSYSQYYRDSGREGRHKRAAIQELAQGRADDDDRQDAGLVRGGGGRAGFRLGRD